MLEKRMQPKVQSLAAAVLAAIALAGCGDNPSRGIDTSSRNAAAQPTTPSTGKSDAPVSDPAPTGPQVADPGDVPTNIPRPIPTPEPPVKPGSIQVTSIAHSVTSYPLNPFGNQGRIINIHVDLKWQLYPGAVGYRISRNDDGGSQFVAKTTVAASHIIKSLPLYWREYSIPAVNQLTPGNKYQYMVEALNSSNKVIASGVDATAPLYPLDVPKLIGPDNNSSGSGIQPSFQWSPVNNADGYFVEVFGGQNFVPQWRGFRAGQQAITMKYGESGEGYPGTMPSIWTMVLSPNAPYTWTVTAYKTDTGNAGTARAFAEANAPSWIFRP